MIRISKDTRGQVTPMNDMNVQTTDSLSIKPATNSQVRTCHFGKMFSKRKGQFLWPEEGANRSNFGMFFFVVEIVPLRKGVQKKDHQRNSRNA